MCHLRKRTTSPKAMRMSCRLVYAQSINFQGADCAHIKLTETEVRLSIISGLNYRRVAIALHLLSGVSVFITIQVCGTDTSTVQPSVSDPVFAEK